MDLQRVLPLLSLVLATACASQDTHEMHTAHEAHAHAAEAAHASLDKPGFVTDVVEGRLWIFRAASEELAEYRRSGEPAKHVTRVGEGPNGMTVKAPDVETMQAYLAAAPGFRTFVVDGRIWVFADGDPAIAEFESTGEPAKHVIRIGVGPMKMTVKSSDNATIDAYLEAVGV